MASNFKIVVLTPLIRTQNKNELLDYVLEKYRQGVFELFNIIASKLDQFTNKRAMEKKSLKNVWKNSTE